MVESGPADLARVGRHFLPAHLRRTVPSHDHSHFIDTAMTIGHAESGLGATYTPAKNLTSSDWVHRWGSRLRPCIGRSNTQHCDVTWTAGWSNAQH